MELFQKTAGDHKDLVAAYINSALAAIIIRYVASVSQPSVIHAVLALLAVAGIVAAYLLIAQSNIEPGAKGATVIAAAAVAGICFDLVGYLV